MTQREEALTALRAARAERDEALKRIRQLVGIARTERATFREIADALGTVPSKIHRKYGRKA